MLNVIHVFSKYFRRLVRNYTKCVFPTDEVETEPNRRQKNLVLTRLGLCQLNIFTKEMKIMFKMLKLLNMGQLEI